VIDMLDANLPARVVAGGQGNGGHRMNIVVTEDTSGWAPRDCRFTAVDDDTWDGAEDGRNRGMVGYGATPGRPSLTGIGCSSGRCSRMSHERRRDYRRTAKLLRGTMA
jgi:hypothetical protein